MVATRELLPPERPEGQPTALRLLPCPLGSRPEDVDAWQETHGRAEDGAEGFGEGRWQDRQSPVHPACFASPRDAAGCDEGQTWIQFDESDLPLFRHAATIRRLRGYVSAAVTRGATLPLAALIGRALETFGLPRSERMLRYYVAELRTLAQVYVFRVRLGRSFVLMVRSSSRPKIHHATATIGSQGDRYKRPDSPGFSRLRRFAFVIARECLEQHWDNCKVRPSLRHAFGFVLRWLMAGRLSQDIARAYSTALHRRHADATDYGLNHGNPATIAWEPSSTVSLASKILQEAPDPPTMHHQRAKVAGHAV